MKKIECAGNILGFWLIFLRDGFPVRNAAHQVSGREIRVNPVVRSWQIFYTLGQIHFGNRAVPHFCTFPTILPLPNVPTLP